MDVIVQQEKTGQLGLPIDILNHYRSALEAAGIGLWNVDLKSDQFFFSFHVWDMLGYQDNEIPHDYSGWKKQIHGDDAAMVESAMHQIYIGKTPRFSIDFRVKHKAGHYIWINNRAEAVYDESGSPKGVKGCFIDISERKDKEYHLNKTLALYKRQADEISQVLACSRYIHLDYTFEKAVRKIFDSAKLLTGAQCGYVAYLDEPENENKVLFIDSGGQPCTIDQDLPVPIRGLRGIAYEENRIVYENKFVDSPWLEYIPLGHLKLRNVLFAPLVIDGHSLGIIGLGNKEGGFDDHDVRVVKIFADLAAISMKNSRNKDKLTGALRDQELLVKEVHHRVRNNLHVISNLLGLEQLSSRDEVSSVIRETRQRIRSMAIIHERLYQSASLTSILFSGFSNLLVDDLCRVHKYDPQLISWHLHNSEDLIFDLSQAVPVSMILTELVSNAICHAAPGDKQQEIIISAGKDDDGIWFSVSDHGKGFNEKEFYPGEIGMGLSLVDMFVRQLKAEIVFSREKLFTITVKIIKRVEIYITSGKG